MNKNVFFIIDPDQSPSRRGSRVIISKENNNDLGKIFQKNRRIFNQIFKIPESTPQKINKKRIILNINKKIVEKIQINLFFSSKFKIFIIEKKKFLLVFFISYNKKFYFF